MKTLKINLTTIILCLFYFISNEINAQQKKWMLSDIGDQYNVPMIDFTGPTPTYYVQPLNNSYSIQTVGNGEFCNSCSDRPDLVSEFFITGAKNTAYNSTTGGLKALQLSWEQICDTNDLINQNIFHEIIDPTKHLSHESLAEIAVGEGEEPGTFWMVLQNSPNTTHGHNGEGVYIYLMDANNNDLSQNEVIDINSVIEVIPGYSSEEYNEGIALGPRFIYEAESGTDPNSPLGLLNGKKCRSVYTCSENDIMHHVLINLESPSLNVVYSDSKYIGKSQMIEIDLSFPQTNLKHPQYLGATGWDGVELITLNENTGKMLSNRELSDDIGGYGLEFDRTDNYIYYTLTPISPQVNITTINKDELSTPNPSTISISGVTGKYLALESAADGNIYALSETGIFYQILNPELSSPTITTLTNNIQGEYTSNSFDINFTLPDWVDGEIPHEIEGGKIEFCVDAFACGTGGITPVDVYVSNTLIQHYDMLPGECQEIAVCPGAQYQIDFNNGDQINYAHIISPSDYFQFNYSASTTLSGYTNYLVNTTISANELWDNKIYIADDVIITVDNGAILDITNVDVLFGSCAGIVLTDGATIRANNSVFRPCDPYQVWRGIEFASSATNPLGWFNECTIKSAKLGIFFNGQSSSITNSVKITNNLFSNCQMGVGGTKIKLSEPITGNTYFFDDNIPDYTLWDCYPWVSDNRRGSIYFWDVSVMSKIAQNDFIYADVVTSLWPNTYGINLGDANKANIVDNNFTNMETAIEIRYSTTNDIKVERNNITISSLINNIEPQIKVYNTSGIELYANSLLNTNYSNGSTPSLIQTGIYVQNSSNVLIRENELKGFETAIQLEGLNNVYTIDNTIDDAWYYGIYSNNSKSMYTSCNKINMDLTSNRETIGIAFYQQNKNSNNHIANNCVLETKIAIYTNGASTSSPLPEIKNNFLYNYTQSGIENINCNGNIGTGIITSTTAGKNTFESNHFSAAIDVNTNVPMNVYGCWGIQNISAGVTLFGNNAYNSSASCGLQLSTQNNVYSEQEFCDESDFSIDLPTEVVVFPSPLDINERIIPIARLNPEHVKTDIISLEDIPSFKIWPVPATDYLNIQWTNILGDSPLLIFNSFGQVVKSVEAIIGETSNTKIDISSLPRGVYYVQINDSKYGNLVKEFVK